MFKRNGKAAKWNLADSNKHLVLIQMSKLRVSFCFITQSIWDVWSGRATSYILSLSTRLSRTVSFTLWVHYYWVKDPPHPQQHPLHRRKGGPQSQPGCCVEKINLCPLRIWFICIVWLCLVTQGNGDITHCKYPNLTNMARGTSHILSAIIIKTDFLIPAILNILFFKLHM